MSYATTVFDLLTKLVNPRFNEFLIACTEYFGEEVPRTTYKVDGVRFRQRSELQRIADKLIEWREDIYRRFGKLSLYELEDAREIVEEYFHVFLFIASFFKEEGGGSILMKLWTLGKELEKELNVDDPIFTVERLLEMAFAKVDLKVESKKSEKMPAIAIAAGIACFIAGLVVGLVI